MSKNLGRTQNTQNGTGSKDLATLLALSKISTISAGLASESTLLSVLNAVIGTKPDIEILLVMDKGNSDVIVQQITDYRSVPPTISYKDVYGDPYVPIGPLEYMNASAVLNTIYTLLETNIDAKLSDLATEDTVAVLKAAATRVHNTIVSSAIGNVPAGSLRGAVFNNGDAAGIWNGISLPSGMGVSWELVGIRDTYTKIDFDATGTTFIIEYTT